ncbi:MAG: proline reductase cluster protein PrdD [Lachnospiraceae bacterium]
MANTDIIQRQLTIRSFHITNVSFSEKFSLKEDLNKKNYWTLTIPKEIASHYQNSSELISKIHIRILPPTQHDIYINSIMDIIPISTKVTGKIGEGVTHTLTGVYVMMTGVDEEGTQVCAFGNSNGILREQVTFNRAGTPSDEDFIILFEVILKAKTGFSRSGPDAAHHACDLFCQEIRALLKKKFSRDCTESHVFQDIIRPNKKKVAIVKLVSGQGAMYDTHFLGQEPSGFEQSRSIIDFTGVPIVLSPNEYRDGAIRAMY